jgi:hypothetical protein
MRFPKIPGFLSMLAFVLVVTAPSALAQPDSSAPPPGVVVSYSHPDQFTEMRTSPASQRSDIKSYLELLKSYIHKRASRVLAPGQNLAIVVTDVAFAGHYEPWTGAPGGWMRVVRRTFPPRIDLHFTLRDAQGKVVKEGTRKLTNSAFMDGPSLHDSDPLRYEKALIDRWLRKGVTGM